MEATRLNDALQKPDLAQALAVCEEYELDHCGTAGASEMLPFYRVQLMSLLLESLVNARWLWERMPEAVKGDAELIAVWGAAQHLWKDELGEAYKVLSTTAWSEPLAAMSKSVIEELRNRSIKLIGTSHSAIAVHDCAVMLGLVDAEAVARCRAQGWEEVGGYVRPVVPEVVGGLVLRKEQLQELTEYVCKLDAR